MSGRLAAFPTSPETGRTAKSVSIEGASVCPHVHFEREKTQGEKKIRCVLALDHVLLRQGLRRLLEDEPDFEVVGEAGSAAECLRKVYELRPDVLVADAGTFGLAAAEAEILVTRESPHTK